MYVRMFDWNTCPLTEVINHGYLKNKLPAMMLSKQKELLWKDCSDSWKQLLLFT